MTIQEEFDGVLRRLLKEENQENRLQYLSGEGEALDRQLELARYLLDRAQALEPGDPRRGEWEADFRRTLENATRLMDQQGWA